jgi:hypothetical protein
VGQIGGEGPLAPGLRRHARAEGGQLLQRLHPQVADPLEKGVQDVHGRSGVGEGAVVGGHRRPHQRGKRAEPVVADLVAAEHVPREPGGVDDGRVRPGEPEPGAAGSQEAGVVGGVVRHEHRSARELEERRERRPQPRSAREQPIGDPGEDGDQRRDRQAGIHQGLELPEHLPGAYLDGADLGDAALLGRAAGGLQVDDDERDLTQRRPELVESGLDGHRSPGGGPGPRRRARHACDGRSDHRHGP